jgi:hypothetical protein
VRHLAAAKKRMIKMKSKSMKRIKGKRKSRSRIFDYKETEPLYLVTSQS